jgi:2-polyprenyl-3-methyl-5-hydroxy-6-metoxy-1,4-benzoquinol methylase
MGGLEGKRVLDLGGGPGQYSVAFAKRGAITTWYDVSRIYHDFSKQKADENGVGINFSIGYLDEAPEILNEQFDLVFNRICWNYGFCDFSFALKLYSLVSPGGVGYIDTTHSGWKRDTLPRGILFRTWLNDTTGVKIGHPHPPHGRLAKIFSQFPIEEISIDYKMETNDRITFRRKLER